MDAFRSLKVAVGIMMSISSYFSTCMQLANCVFTQHRRRQGQLLPRTLTSHSIETWKNRLILKHYMHNSDEHTSTHKQDKDKDVGAKNLS